MNHTEKLAVNLGEYFVQSMFMMKNRDLAAIDLIPALTETGGGTSMALFDGISADSTEELAGAWCGDLLQIVDKVPGGYKLIHCCFAEIWDKAKVCYYLFGVDESNYLLGDINGKRYECAKRDLWRRRGPAYYLKIELTEDSIQYIPVPKQ